MSGDTRTPLANLFSVAAVDAWIATLDDEKPVVEHWYHCPLKQYAIDHGYASAQISRAFVTYAGERVEFAPRLIVFTHSVDDCGIAWEELTGAVVKRLWAEAATRSVFAYTLYDPYAKGEGVLAILTANSYHDAYTMRQDSQHLRSKTSFIYTLHA